MLILETNRLRLYQFSLGDASFIFELVNDPAFIQYIGDRGVKTLANANEFITTRLIASYEKNGFGLYHVKLKENNSSIGMCGLVKRDFLNDVDIGYAFLPDFRGQGFAFEAAEAVLAYAENKLNIPRIVAITDRENVPSMRLLEKLGLHLERTITYPDDDTAVNLYVPNHNYSPS